MIKSTAGDAACDSITPSIERIGANSCSAVQQLLDFWEDPPPPILQPSATLLSLISRANPPYNWQDTA